MVGIDCVCAVPGIAHSTPPISVADRQTPRKAAIMPMSFGKDAKGSVV